MRGTIFMIVLSMIALSTAALADVPGEMNYQGTLTDAYGVALDTTVSMTFTIYDDSTGGSAKWTETQPAVEVSSGIFNVLLGSVNAISDTVFDDPERWLGVQVGVDPEMIPRQKLVSVPYAFHAAEAETADYALTAPAASDSDWTISGDNMYSAVSGNVGIGTSSPLCKLDVSGSNQRIHVGNWIGPDGAGAILSDGDSSGAVFSNNVYHSGVGWANQNTGKVGAFIQISDDDIYVRRSGSGSGPAITTNMMVNGATGDVGIGRAPYWAKLDVAGEINADSVYELSGSTVLSRKGTQNIFVGPGAGGNNTGQYGTFVGYLAGHDNEGSSNTFMGDYTGYSNTTGGYNTFIGAYAGSDNATANDNTFIGYRAGALNTTGIRSTFLGSEAGGSNTTGSFNAALGQKAGYSNEAGERNVFLGYHAGYYETGSQKLYIANGMDSSDVLIFGDFVTGHVGIGIIPPSYALDVAGDVNTNTVYRIDGATVLAYSATNNVMVGVGAGENNTADFGTFIGYNAGFNNQGNDNTFLGTWAGQANTDGHQNTFLGSGCGDQNTTGDFNTFVGMGAGGSHTEGYDNTFLGRTSGFATTTGDANVFLGNYAGYLNQTGNFNICVGYQSGYNNVGGHRNVFLGGYAGYYETGSDKLYIANGSDTSDVLIYGDFATGRVGIGTMSPGATLDLEKSTSGRVLDIVSTYSSTVGQTVNIERTQNALEGNDLLQITVPSTSDSNFQFIECQRGDVKFKVEGDGDVFADGSYTGPADFSEMIAVSSGALTVEPGDVMVIDPHNTRSAVRSAEPRSTLVAGIYSTRPGFVGSERNWDKPSGGQDGEMSSYTMGEMAAQFSEVPLAVVGIVPCKVSAENGAINPGDLLVTSTTPGHAMRDEAPKTGTVLGKALESLSSGTGKIKVLVTLH